MPRFELRFEKDWKEYGSVVIEAADKAEADERAKEMIETDDQDIEWESSNMDIQGQDVLSVKQLD